MRSVLICGPCLALLAAACSNTSDGARAVRDSATAPRPKAAEGAARGPAGPPRPGASGARTPAPLSSPSPPANLYAIVIASVTDPDPTADTVEVSLFGEATTVDVSVTARGGPPYASPIPLVYGVGGADDGASATWSFKPCDVAGGRDQPGATFAISVKAIPPATDSNYDGKRRSVTLGADTRKPAILSFNPSVADGSTVARGTKIDFEVMADDVVVANYAWQTGVRQIHVESSDGYRKSSAQEPLPAKACKARKPVNWKVPPGDGNVYKVTTDGLIRLCAHAEDYKGNLSDKKCVTYNSKTSSWKGTLRSEWKGSVCNGIQEGAITLLVAGTEVSGSSATTGRQSCPSIPFSQAGPQTAQLQGEFAGSDSACRSWKCPASATTPAGAGGNPRRPIVINVTPDGTAEGRYEWASAPSGTPARSSSGARTAASPSAERAKAASRSPGKVKGGSREDCVCSDRTGTRARRSRVRPDAA